MEFKEKIYASDGLYGHMFKFICDEFIRNLKEHPEISEFTKKNNIPILAKECYTSDMMNQELEWYKGHLRKDDVKIALRNWRDKEQNSTLGVYTEWACHNGKIWIRRFTLQIRIAPLCIDICKRINDLDLYKRYLSWAVKHELGHVIDYINTRHGLSIEEFNAIMERDQADYNRYFDETATDIPETIEQLNESNRKYYMLTQERAANDAIGITVDEMIEICTLRYNRYENKKMTLTINQSDIHDIPKEENNDK